MNVPSDKAVKWLDHLITDTQYMMELLNYTPTEEDYMVNNDGKKEVTQEWVDNMPRAYALLMGKHDALVRLKKRFLDSEDLVESEANKRNIFLSDPRNN
jgi:L-lysine 2,3-aminomutase